MMQIPDAPWIREAERNGYPVGDEMDWDELHREDDDEWDE